MPDTDLTLVPTDALFKELVRRFDAMVFAGTKVLVETDTHVKEEVVERYGGRQLLRAALADHLRRQTARVVHDSFGGEIAGWPDDEEEGT
jgi:hypothetical protein